MCIMQRDVRRNGKPHLPLINTRREAIDHIRHEPQIESTQDDPRVFHGMGEGGDFDDFPGRSSLNPHA